MRIEGSWFRVDVCQRDLPPPASEQCVLIDKTWRMVYVKTPEATLRASVGDWLVRSVKGEVYPVRQAVFDRTYEPV